MRAALFRDEPLLAAEFLKLGLASGERCDRQLAIAALAQDFSVLAELGPVLDALGAFHEVRASAVWEDLQRLSQSQPAPL